MTSCVVIPTYFSVDYQHKLKVLKQIHDDMPDGCQLHIMVSNQIGHELYSDMIEKACPNAILETFSYDFLRAKYPKCFFKPIDQQHYNVWCMWWLVFLWFYDNHKEYDKYLLLEDDLWLNGLSWNDIIKKIINDRHAIMMQDYRCEADDKWVYVNITHELPEDMKIFVGLLNMMSISNEAFHELHEFIHDKLGHPELLINSFVHNQSKHTVGCIRDLFTVHAEWRLKNLLEKHSGLDLSRSIIHPIKNEREYEMLCDVSDCSQA